MLYMSTRNQTDTHTAFCTLQNDFAPDGGLFLPLAFPKIEANALRELLSQPGSGIIAHILNLFFSAQLSAWEVDCCIGRNAIRVLQQPHKLVIAELWHNTDGTYAALEQSLYDRLCDGRCDRKPTLWAKTAILIAVLFAVVGEAGMMHGTKPDISVIAGDFVHPAAALFAKGMGLPLNTILMADIDNSAVWDLIQHGEFATQAMTAGHPAQAPTLLEYLIFCRLGSVANEHFRSVCARRGIFRIDEQTLDVLKDGLFSAVVGSERIPAIIRSIDRTNGYAAEETFAVAFGCVQDYRACTGQSRETLILACHAPGGDKE